MQIQFDPHLRSLLLTVNTLYLKQISTQNTCIHHQLNYLMLWFSPCRAKRLHRCCPSWKFPSGHNVLPPRAFGIHHLFLGRCSVVFLFSGVFLCVDVLPKEISPQGAKESYRSGKKNERRTIPWPYQTWKQRAIERKQVLSNCFPQQETRNFWAKASVRGK